MCSMILIFLIGSPLILSNLRLSENDRTRIRQTVEETFLTAPNSAGTLSASLLSSFASGECFAQRRLPTRAELWGDFGVRNEVRLFRCFLRSRVEKKLAHLAGHIAGDGSLLRPCECLIHIGGFQYPKSAHVLLGLDVRSVGDEHLAVGLLSQRLCVGGRGNAAGELPHAGSNEFAVERVDLFHHRFGYGGRVEVVGEVVSNQILWHDFFSLVSVVCFR